MSVCNQKDATTKVTIPLVIYIKFSMNLFLFKSQLLRKLFYIINNVGLICMLITCNCIYIYNQTAVYSVNRNTNLYIDLKRFDFSEYLLDIIDFCNCNLILYCLI